MYQVLSFTVFSFVSYIPVHMPLRMYWPRLFFVVFQEIQCLTMTMFVTSQSFISLPSFMFVSAAVSEIHDLNQNKKEKKFENGNFQFTTFPRHITDPFF